MLQDLLHATLQLLVLGISILANDLVVQDANVIETHAELEGSPRCISVGAVGTTSGSSSLVAGREGIACWRTNMSL